MRVLMLSARRAGWSFEEAWDLAATTILGNMSDRSAADWYEVIEATRKAWADAYDDARSPLALLPREVPQPVGYTVAEPGRSRRRRAVIV